MTEIHNTILNLHQQNRLAIITVIFMFDTKSPVYVENVKHFEKEMYKTGGVLVSKIIRNGYLYVKCSVQVFLCTQMANECLSLSKIYL